jgi:hypothetical protein
MKDKEGNTVIASKPYRWTENDQSCQVVLREVGGVEPFVTHVYDSNKDSYFWGHYFRNVEDALEDFNERS